MNARPPARPASRARSLRPASATLRSSRRSTTRSRASPTSSTRCSRSWTACHTPTRCCWSTTAAPTAPARRSTRCSAEHPDRITVIHLSRNFGHQAALTAGMDYADGDAVICLDADMQHPPELIPQLVARWEEGFDIVQATRARRADGELVQAAHRARLLRADQPPVGDAHRAQRGRLPPAVAPRRRGLQAGPARARPLRARPGALGRLLLLHGRLRRPAALRRPHPLLAAPHGELRPHRPDLVLQDAAQARRRCSASRSARSACSTACTRSSPTCSSAPSSPAGRRPCWSAPSSAAASCSSSASSASTSPPSSTRSKARPLYIVASMHPAAQRRAAARRAARPSAVAAGPDATLPASATASLREDR